MFIKPMLAATIDVVPEDGTEWIVERKYDGWRAIAGSASSGEGVWVETRTGKRISSVPYLNDALQAWLPAGTVVDGEVVDLSPGRRQWNRVQTILSRTARNYRHVPTLEDPALTYVVST
jgi:ATP-dependent DNA ligase